jgi:inner membrane protein
MTDQIQSAPQTQTQIFIKLGLVLFLVLLLMIPIIWVQSLINERETLQANVQQEVAHAWGREQVLKGPVLCIPYELRGYGADKKPYIERHWRYIAPEDLQVTANVATETRKKGIFETVVYNSATRIQGVFNLEELPDKGSVRYLFAEAALLTGISDPSTITQKIVTQWEGAEIKTMPGTPYNGFVGNGFHTFVPIDPEKNQYRFDVALDFRGTSSLDFLPSGRNTQIQANSNWASPSFTGRNLPAKREITTSGFSATWNASEYNRPFPDFWSDDAYQALNDQVTFGVKLIQTADHYQKNMRSAKYALLVISLSFMVFFFFEIMLKIRIHPIQYGMIGLGLAIFYLLLLSLTEHLGFDQAYLISAGAVIGLVVFYALAFLPNKKTAALLTLLFLMLYAYIFVLLQLEDYALLAGSVGLFLILATVMLLSKRVNWYSLTVER